MTRPTEGQTWPRPSQSGADGADGTSFVWRGAWSGATAYVIDDVVSLGGSSYICILGHTNHTPPNGTYWNVLASGTSGAALDDLSDVTVPTPSDGDVLTFDNGLGEWTAQAPTGGGGGSTPTLVGSPTQWFEADSGIGVAGGAAVPQWNDQSGNGYHLVQATGANRPTFRSQDVSDGLPYVEFDGTNDILIKTGMTTYTGTVLTVYGVARLQPKTGSTAGEGLFSLVSGANNDYDNAGSMGFSDFGLTVAAPQVEHNSALYRATSAALVPSGAPLHNGFVFQAFCVRFSESMGRSIMTFFLENERLTVDLAASPHGAFSVAIAALGGRYSGGASGFNLRADVRAWGWYPAAHTDAQVYQNLSYLGNKWKVPGLAGGSGTSGGASTLDALTDVDVPTPANGNVLTYNTVSGHWEAVAPGSGGVADADYGDVVVSGTGAVWTVDNDVITNAKLANMATARFKARVTAGTGDPEDLTGTQATTLLDAFTSALKGLAPASGGGTTNYLRADGSWAAPPGDHVVADADYGDIVVSSTGTVWTIDAAVVSNAKLATMATATFKGRTTAGTGAPEDLTATQATAMLNAFTSTLKGLAPASGGGTTTFLRADATWAAVPIVVPDADYGDIVISSTGTVWTIDSGVVSNAKLATMATATFKGRTTAGTGAPEDLTATQATALLNAFSSTLKGLVPLSGGGTTNYLRADGTWAAPPGDHTVSDADYGDVVVSSTGTVWTIDTAVVTNAKLATMATASFKGRTTAGTGAPEDLTATQATALLNVFTSALKGLVPLSGGGTTTFLRADATWAAVPIVVPDADYGDIVISSTGTVWTIDAAVVTNAKLANMATARFKGRTTAGTGDPEDLTATQATAMLNAFTSTLQGVAPLSGGGTTNFLRADATWAAPIGQRVDVQVFTTPGAFTWTKPLNVNMVRVIAIGGGGGGGSGRRAGAATAAGGGSGGAGGAVADMTFTASELGATVAGVVGTGGPGGAVVTTAANGNDGTAGTDSSFGSTLKGFGGPKGIGATTAGGTAPTNAWGSSVNPAAGGGLGVQGTAGTANASASSAGRCWGPRGGAGASGTDGSAATGNGGAGGGPPINSSASGGGGSAGVTGTHDGGNGASSVSGDPHQYGGSGGGGGFGSVAGNGGNGGNGGTPGGGGGGGAGTATGTQSGSGGNGGDGKVVVMSY